MPPPGMMISGILLLLIGTLFVSRFRKIGMYIYTHDNLTRTNYRGPSYNKFGVFTGGLVVMGWGLHIMNFSILSILMLVPAVLLLFHFKKTARAVMVFCYGSEPYERTIIKGQYILLVLTLVLITGAVYLSMKDWVNVSV